MSRKKKAKSAPRSKTAKKSQNIAMQIEKDYLALPQQLAGHFSQTAATLKQKTAKIKASLEKSEANVNKLEKTIQLAKTKKTAASRKKATSAKKTQAKAKQQMRSLTTELSTIEKSIQALDLKHAKMQALRKCLTQFEKEWTKTAKDLKKKSTEAVAKKANKKKAAKKTAGRKSKSTKNITNASNQSSYQPTIEDMNFSDQEKTNL